MNFWTLWNGCYISLKLAAGQMWKGQSESEALGSSLTTVTKQCVRHGKVLGAVSLTLLNWEVDTPAPQHCWIKGDQGHSLGWEALYIIIIITIKIYSKGMLWEAYCFLVILMLIIIHSFTFYFFQPDLIVFNESFPPFITNLVWQIVFSRDCHTKVYPILGAALWWNIFVTWHISIEADRANVLSPQTLADLCNYLH